MDNQAFIMEKTCMNGDFPFTNDRYSSGMSPYYYKMFCVVIGTVESIDKMIEFQNLEEVVDYLELYNDLKIINGCHPSFPRYPEFIDIEEDCEIYSKLSRDNFDFIARSGINIEIE